MESQHVMFRLYVESHVMFDGMIFWGKPRTKEGNLSEEQRRKAKRDMEVNTFWFKPYKERFTLLRSSKCSVCEERKRPDPRRQANLHVHTDRWRSVQMDAAYWKHPKTQQKLVVSGCSFG